MTSNQFFTKELNVNKSFSETYDYLLKLASIRHFPIDSENKVMNKIVYKYFNNKIEVSIEKVSDEITKLRISIMDRNNSYYKPCDLASTDALNFENALTAIISGNPEAYQVTTSKVGSEGILQLILVVAGFVALAYGIFVLFLK